MRETYFDLIAPRPRTTDGRARVLLGLIFYIDGCQLGMYQGKNIEILKMSHSCLKYEVRNQPYAWRNVGYIPNRIKGRGEADRQFETSQHVDSAKYAVDPEYRKALYQQGKASDVSTLDSSLYTQGDNPPEIPEVKAQDLSTCNA